MSWVCARVLCECVGDRERVAGRVFAFKQHAYISIHKSICPSTNQSNHNLTLLLKGMFAQLGSSLLLMKITKTIDYNDKNTLFRIRVRIWHVNIVQPLHTNNTQPQTPPTLTTTNLAPLPPTITPTRHHHHHHYFFQAFYSISMAFIQLSYLMIRHSVAKTNDETEVRWGRVKSL